VSTCANLSSVFEHDLVTFLELVEPNEDDGSVDKYKITNAGNEYNSDLSMISGTYETTSFLKGIC
jgi:hypothetical protein